jgi:hypothetical protein
MGASEWYYFVPYQEDVSQAFQELRLKIFAEGDYYEGWYGPDPDSPPLKSIEDLIERQGTEGTHSILDIERIDAEPGFGVITPLSEEDILGMFGTNKPSRKLVEEFFAPDDWDAGDYCNRWEGVYLVMYKDEEPDEILFVGFSGD